MTNSVERGIEIFRCTNCKRLLTIYHTQGWKGKCKCGGRMFSGASPTGLIEYIKCLYWSYRYKPYDIVE